jgi:hypothetical protein
MSSDFRGGSGEICELPHTSLFVQKMHGRAGRPKNNGILSDSGPIKDRPLITDARNAFYSDG